MSNKCEVCGQVEVHEPCASCGEVVHIGEWPFCPHGFARGGNAFQSYPYTTKNITPDGQEVEVTSRAHERALLADYKRQTGNELVRRDDAAFLNAEYLGHNMHTDKQEYSEGSGRGMPGQWI